MAENSETSPTTPDKDEPKKEEENLSPAALVEEELRPKTRGTPKGSKDAKPRIKRVPVAAPEEQEAEKKTATPKVAAPKSKPKKVEVQEPTEEEGERQPEEAPEEAPPPPKSPRTLQRERAHALAAERRKAVQARQDHFERVLDNFIGF